MVFIIHERSSEIFASWNLKLVTISALPPLMHSGAWTFCFFLKSIISSFAFLFSVEGQIIIFAPLSQPLFQTWISWWLAPPRLCHLSILQWCWGYGLEYSHDCIESRETGSARSLVRQEWCRPISHDPQADVDEVEWADECNWLVCKTHFVWSVFLSKWNKEHSITAFAN